MFSSTPPVSSFIPRSEREELMVVFATAVYAKGLAGVQLADVARLAAVPESVVHGYWTNETACLIETVETATEQAFSRMAEVFLNSDDDCSHAAHRALATLLADLATGPEMVHLSVVELPRLGTVSHTQQNKALDLFCEFLGPGFLAMGRPIPDPELVSVCLAGGIWEIVRRMAIERTLHELPDALAAMSFVCISTFFGTDEARRVSQIPVRVPPRSSSIP